jgi:membrane-bound lytic murein transglycosylase B
MTLRRVASLVVAVAIVAASLGAGVAQPSRQPATETVAAGQASSFARFVAGLRPDAQAAGIARATFDAAFAGVQPDPKVIVLTR